MIYTVILTRITRRVNDFCNIKSKGQSAIIMFLPFAPLYNGQKAVGKRKKSAAPT